MDDKYICSLSEKNKKLALEELREDDNIREQSLQKMKEWIRKTSYIKYSRTDAVFLLRFLRANKFSIPLACEMLENYILSRQVHPQWFHNMDCDDKVLNELIDAGYILLLPEKHEGKAVIMSRLSKFDPYKYTSADMVKVSNLVFEALADDEEVQVNGVIYICDTADYQIAHLNVISFKDLIVLLRMLQTAYPGRQKGYYFFNFSTIFTKFLEFGRMLLSEKLKNRIFISSTLEGLKTKIDPKILPKEYGGEVPYQDMIDQFKKLLQERKQQLLALDDLKIKIDKNNQILKETSKEFGLGGGVEGSFKKSQID